MAWLRAFLVGLVCLVAAAAACSGSEFSSVGPGHDGRRRFGLPLGARPQKVAPSAMYGQGKNPPAPMMGETPVRSMNPPLGG